MSRPYDFIFMLEEESAKIVLENLLSKICPDNRWRCIAHEGKSHLQKSLKIKLRAWQGVKFIILHDQDNHDCVELKQKLRELCKASGHPDCLIRIVCRELEAWYFGDWDALGKAYPDSKILNYRKKPKYCDPDKITNPKAELERLIEGFQSVSAARKISQYMDIEKNESPSFKIFVNGVKLLAGLDIKATKSKSLPPSLKLKNRSPQRR